MFPPVTDKLSTARGYRVLDLYLSRDKEILRDRLSRCPNGNSGGHPTCFRSLDGHLGACPLTLWVEFVAPNPAVAFRRRVRFHSRVPLGLSDRYVTVGPLLACPPRAAIASVGCGLARGPGSVRGRAVGLAATCLAATCLAATWCRSIEGQEAEHGVSPKQAPTARLSGKRIGSSIALAKASASTTPPPAVVISRRRPRGADRVGTGRPGCHAPSAGSAPRAPHNS